jgi:hypothetical protein
MAGNTQNQSDYRKWLQLAPLGLLLTGFGLSLVGDASNDKQAGRRWFVKGTLGLIVFNAGLAIFGDAVKSRAIHELNELNT